MTVCLFNLIRLHLTIGLVVLVYLMTSVGNGVQCQLSKTSQQRKPFQRNRDESQANNKNKNEQHNTKPRLMYDDELFELTVPRNDPNNACIKMNASFFLKATYDAKNESGLHSNMVSFSLSDRDNFTYTGYCRADKSVVELKFLNEWRLELYFNRESTNHFVFKHVVLYYKLTGTRFPNSIHNGAQSEVYESVFVNSTMSKAYQCLSGVEIDLNEVIIHIRNLRIEPFFSKRPNVPFESEVVCSPDLPKFTSDYSTQLWILGIIVCSVLVFVFCCGWYVCYKLKFNKSYQPVNQPSVTNVYDPPYRV